MINTPPTTGEGKTVLAATNQYPWKSVTMAFNRDSKVGELLDNEAARKVLDNHMPAFSSNPQLAMAKNFSLTTVAGFSGGKITPEMLAAIEADLAKL